MQEANTPTLFKPSSSTVSPVVKATSPYEVSAIPTDRVSEAENKFALMQKKFSQANWLPRWIQYRWQDPCYFDMLKLLCLNDYNLAMKSAHLDASWIQVALYLPCNDLCWHWFEANPHFAIYFLDSTAHAGNMLMLSYLMGRFSLQPTQSTLSNAVHAGDASLVKFLLEPRFKLTLKTDMLYSLERESSNYILVKFFYDNASRFNLKLRDIDNFALKSLQSGDIRLFHYLKSLNKWTTKELIEEFYLSNNTQDSLAIAKDHNVLFDLDLLADSGKVDLYSYCINNLGGSATQNHLKTAILTGNYFIAKFLLEFQTQFKLEVTDDLMEEAIDSGHCLIIELLLASKHQLSTPTIARAKLCITGDVTYSTLRSYQLADMAERLFFSRPFIAEKLLIISGNISHERIVKHRRGLNAILKLDNLGLLFKFLNPTSYNEVFSPIDRTKNALFGNIFKSANFAQFIFSKRNYFESSEKIKTADIEELIKRLEESLQNDHYHCLIFAKLALQLFSKEKLEEFLDVINNSSNPRVLAVKPIILFALHKTSFKNDRQLPDWIRYTWLNAQSDDLLVTLCDTNPSPELVARLELPAIIHALYMHNNKLCKQWLQTHREATRHLNQLLASASDAGNLEMVSFLLSPENAFKVRPTQKTLLNAIHSGNVKLIHFLLKYSSDLYIDASILTLKSYAKSSIALIEFFKTMPPSQQNRLQNVDINEFIRLSIECGDEQIWHYLGEGAEFTYKDLSQACASGNYQLVLNLLNKEIKNPTDNQSNALNFAVIETARFGHIELFENLLNHLPLVNQAIIAPETGLIADFLYVIPNLKPALVAACSQGNLSFVRKQLTIHKSRTCAIKIDQDILTAASLSKNNLLLEELTPFCEYNVKPCMADTANTERDSSFSTHIKC